MKPILAFLVLMIFGLKIIANPIALPTLEISELYFENSGEWILEIAYYDESQTGIQIDSMFLYSTEDSVKLHSYTLTGIVGVFVITPDSLDSEFTIKRNGDTIKLVYYIYDEPLNDILVFGDAEGATIHYPRTGQSISRYWIYYVKDNSPSIGALNDTSGMCGTIKGTVYDQFLLPVASRVFLMDNKFETSGNGEFSARVYAKPSCFDQLFYSTGGYYCTELVPISQIDYVMEPDSVVFRDIYLLDTLASGLSDINNSNALVKVYPNPVSASEKLTVEIDLPVITSDIWIEMVSIDGKRIRKESIKSRYSEIETPVESGVYIVSIWLDNQRIASKRILVKNE